MIDDPGQSMGINPQSAWALIGINLRRLRRAAMVTQETLAKAIDLDVAKLSALELGYGVLPINALPPLAAALGISIQELIVALGEDITQVVQANQTVSNMTALTVDRIEIIRLRDALDAERHNAECQFEFLAKRNGTRNIFTREAATRMERLTIVLGLGPDEDGAPGTRKWRNANH